MHFSLLILIKTNSLILESAQILSNHLLPFGESSGDQLLQSTDDGSSEPQVEIDPCPVFGVEQDTIYVSC